MTKKSLLWFISFFLLITLNVYITLRYIGRVHKVEASLKVLEEIDQATPIDQVAQADPTDAKKPDERVANLKNFFRKHNSPLFESSELIVSEADKHKFDYRLLPAIAMQESTLCRAIPVNSYNCWGWGIYGNTVTRFASYDEAIITISRGIKKNYIDQGLVTPSQIMSKYTPSSNGSWARAVNSVMSYLE